MGRAEGWVLFATALPLGLIAMGGEAAGQPEGSSAEGQQASAEPEAVPKKGEDERPPARLDEGGTLEKRLERLRSTRSGPLEQVRLTDPGARIAPATLLVRQEALLPPPEPSLDRAESLPELAGPEKERWFRTREWRARFADLRRCPGEIAFRRSVGPREVPAGRVLLRWTTDGQGRVRDAAVVATGGGVDPDVMSCIHRKMGEWQFVPPPATPYRADWTLNLARR
jgi:hypothetical protein